MNRRVQSGSTLRRKLLILGRYLGHLVIGAAMFTSLLLIGMTLNLLVKWSAPIIADPSFTTLMGLVERLILYCDVALIVWWVMYSTVKAIREMSDE